MSTIYDRPHDYDLEHEGDDEDVRFYVELMRTLRPRRLLELAAGNGRVTLPLAQAAIEDGVEIVGLEISDVMLAEAERKRADLPDAARRRVTFVRGDLREWEAEEPFDLILTPCSSLAHILALDEQIAAWRRAHDNLAPNGCFVVDLTMPDLAAYADSMRTPPRILVEIDSDTRDPDTGTRLVRYKATRYVPHEQRAEIQFTYDRLSENVAPERYISDFASHVYYPREVELLFRLTGFEVVSRLGDYRMRPLRQNSRAMIFTGVRQ